MCSVGILAGRTRKQNCGLMCRQVAPAAAVPAFTQPSNAHNAYRAEAPRLTTMRRPLDWPGFAVHGHARESIP